MNIQSMFKSDINREINGVVKVDQDESNVLVQELDEYVITRELKKHFLTFFNGFLEKTENTVKYVISKDIRWHLRDALDQMNVNERMIYPGLDGVAKVEGRHYYVRDERKH